MVGGSSGAIPLRGPSTNSVFGLEQPNDHMLRLTPNGCQSAMRDRVIPQSSPRRCHLVRRAARSGLNAGRRRHCRFDLFGIVLGADHAVEQRELVSDPAGIGDADRVDTGRPTTDTNN